jgi:hypothetical protein
MNAIDCGELDVPVDISKFSKKMSDLDKKILDEYVVIRLFPSMPLGLAGLRELIRRRFWPPPPAVRTFYSNFDWLEGLASWPATNLLIVTPCRTQGF